MGAQSHQVINYLALLADPEQNRIVREAWTVASRIEDLPWAGWQPASVVSVLNEPSAAWYDDSPAPRQALTAASQPAKGLVDKGLSGIVANVLSGMITEDQPNPLQQKIDELSPEPPAAPTPPPGLDGDELRTLAAFDELHREETRGRVGWIFIAGSIRFGDEIIPCCFPLFERRVRFRRVRGAFYPQWQGALQRSPLLRRREPDAVEDPIDAFLKTGAANKATIGQDIVELLAYVGVTATGIADSAVHPLSVDPSQGTVIVPGAGFYLARANEPFSSSSNDLSRWAGRHLSDTALARLYRSADAAPYQERKKRSIRTALPLNARQREAIDRLCAEPLVAISGPPGTGKTHTIVAAAADLVAQGLSVLVATKSNFAAESACELLEKYPTPPHIRFGSEAHRRHVADRLSLGQATGVTDAQFASLSKADDVSGLRLEQLGESVLNALRRKQAFELIRNAPETLSYAGAERMLSPGFVVSEVDDLVRKVVETSGLRQNRSLSRLRKLIGAPDTASLEDMRRSIAGAKNEIAVRTALDNALGDDLDDLWAELDRTESDARAARAIVDIARRSRPTPEAIAAISSLATALRGSTGGRQLTIPIQASAAFLHHLPFWVGTLDEIEATLPPHPGMFDVVIFDEASQIDQLSAVPALCRARQAVVVGDPQQLRHQTSVTAQQVDAARTHAGIGSGDDAMNLDVAANSLFDVAAASSPITWLNEHFRSTPHLIHFSSERWYDSQLRLMTQHPRNEELDAIDIQRVAAQRDGRVNGGEIDAILHRLQQYRQVGTSRSIGVITPFEEQAAALEQAIVAQFDYDDIRALRLRVGTVRGVQGTERDVIMLSLVVDDDDPPEAFTAIEDRHLFNVMITRARSKIEVFHSFNPENLRAGLLADWFRYESRPPGIGERSSAPTSRWTAELARELELAGVRVVTSYPVAGWTVDLVIGEGDAAFGVETTVHPSGPEAHAERHLTLRRAGWDLVSVFENSWLLKPQDAAIHLAAIAARRHSKPHSG